MVTKVQNKLQNRQALEIDKVFRIVHRVYAMHISTCILQFHTFLPNFPEFLRTESQRTDNPSIINGMGMVVVVISSITSL